jgi:hypothetical protein
MSNKIRKTAPARPKKWHPSALACAQAIWRSEENGGAPAVFDPQVFDEITQQMGGRRLLSGGEITKGRRYIAREDRRKAYESERREFEREQLELAERKARLELERKAQAERKARLELERKARAERKAADARKLASAREAMEHLNSESALKSVLRSKLAN